MEKGTSKNGGFAVVYGLAVLLLASIGGMSIMYVSQKDKITASDYSKMRTAANAARAALDAFEGQCNSRPQEVLDILRQYKKKPAYKWLLNTADKANSETKFKCWNGVDAPLLSACIMKFDSAQLLIQVKGIGYGGLGGKKNAIGIYKLKGIGLTNSWAQKDAIYLAGEGRNFDRKIIVNGNVYFGADVHFNGSAEGSIINGDFKTGNSSEQSEFDVPFTIKGKAYFQTPIKVNGTYGFTVYGESGFEKSINTGPNLYFYNNVYVNGAVAGNGQLDMNFNKITYSGLYIPIVYKFKNPGSSINNRDKIDIASILQMKTGNDPHLIANVNGIPLTKIIKISNLRWSNFTASTLQTKYENAYAKGQLWNDFLVINVDAIVSMADGGGTFNGKVIWIVENKMNCNGNWYDCDPTSNTLVYVKSGGSVIGLGSGKKFRGYVHVEGSGNVTYLWKSGNSFKGAIHHVSDNSGFQLNSSNGVDWNISFDESVLNEFMESGLITPPGGNTGGFVINDVKLRPELVSISY